MVTHPAPAVSRIARMFCSLFPVLALAPWTAAAQSVKLNAPLERAPGIGVREVRMSPDGAWVVFEAPQDSQEPGLYSAPLDGSRAAVRLVPPGFSCHRIEVGNEVVVLLDADLYVVPIDGSRPPALLLPHDPGRYFDRFFRISPDGERLVYVAGTGGWELFSLPLGGGGDPVELSGGPAQGLFWDLVISPDGERVIYLSNHDTAEEIELFSAPIDGSAPAVRLNGPLVPGGDVVTYLQPPAFTPDGGRVLYLADQETDGVVELFVVPSDGSASPVKLNAALVAGGNVQAFQAGDGERVVYAADQLVDGREELFAVPLDASAAPLKLNGSVPTAGDVTRHELGPDGLHVVYFASEDGDPVRELYTVPLDRSRNPMRLTPRHTDWVEFSPDGSRVVYQSYWQGRVDLYSVSLVRRDSIELTRTPQFGAHAYSGFRITPGGSVVYLEEVRDRLELRKVPLDGTAAPVVLAGPFSHGGPVSTNGYMELGLGGRQVLLHAILGGAAPELFSFSVDGQRELVRLNGPLVPEQVIADVTSFRASPDGANVVYSVFAPGPNDPGHGWLFGVPLDGSSAPVELYSQMNGQVGGQELAPDGTRVVFKAGQVDSGFDLFSMPPGGELPPVQLNDPTTSAYGVGAFRLSPDGAWVVFASYQGESSELYSAPLEGGAEIELSGELAEGGYIREFRITADGERVVYLADEDGESYELFGVPIDGSSGPVRLNGLLVPGGDVSWNHDSPSFQLASDGSRVVYRADQLEDERFELFSVPLDASEPAVRLSGTLVAGGDVQPVFRLDPGTARVFFRADAVTDEVVELLAAPLDGAAPPVVLSGALVAGGDVQADLEVAGDGRVVYRADAVEDERIELFAVPGDGSAAPLRLSGALVAGGDVQPSLRISADGRRVVYRADQRLDEQVELFGVPSDGSAGAICLGGPYPDGADVLETLRITPDDVHVLYVADQEEDEVFELRVTPLDRAEKGRRLNGSLVPGGDAAVRDIYGRLTPQFDVTSDGRHALYLADEDADEVFELYRSALGGPVSTATPRRIR